MRIVCAGDYLNKTGELEQIILKEAQEMMLSLEELETILLMEVTITMYFKVETVLIL